MTPELTVLALAALLQSVQILLAAAAMNRDVGRRVQRRPARHRAGASRP